MLFFGVLVSAFHFFQVITDDTESTYLNFYRVVYHVLGPGDREPSKAWSPLLRVFSGDPLYTSPPCLSIPVYFSGSDLLWAWQTH